MASILPLKNNPGGQDQMRPTLIRWTAYPAVFGTCSAVMIDGLSRGWTGGFKFAAVAAVGILAVAALERVQPYEAKWNEDHHDTRVDFLHACVSLTLIFFSSNLIRTAQELVPIPALWPQGWPSWIQVLLAGAILDFGLWFMHLMSHRNRTLWRFHAIHHSSERLYWLNGERRHPVSALLLAGPGLIMVAGLGAPPEIVGCWMAIISVHLAFQHANLDYQVGPLKRLIAVAEAHRWHHKREYEDAQVNFGEFWLIWDRLFGTYLEGTGRVGPTSVGLRDEVMPTDYLGQLHWPWVGPTDVKKATADGSGEQPTIRRRAKR